ncbi:MAG: hypothetical protein JKY02_08140 [Flavobacteriaceae bacterium]|nr:hypothetical protein [Flavobacteriaceae bacterium]
MVAQENNSKTVLVIVVGFLAISLYFEIKPLLYVALGIGGLSTLSSTLEGYIVLGWNKIALTLGWFTSRVVLTLVFFIFLTPLALLKKLVSSKDPLKIKDTATTYVDRSITYSKKDLENIW